MVQRPSWVEAIPLREPSFLHTGQVTSPGRLAWWWVDHQPFLAGQPLGYKHFERYTTQKCLFLPHTRQLQYLSQLGTIYPKAGRCNTDGVGPSGTDQDLTWARGRAGSRILFQPGKLLLIVALQPWLSQHKVRYDHNSWSTNPMQSNFRIATVLRNEGSFRWLASGDHSRKSSYWLLPWRS